MESTESYACLWIIIPFICLSILSVVSLVFERIFIVADVAVLLLIVVVLLVAIAIIIVTQLIRRKTSLRGLVEKVRQLWTGAFHVRDAIATKFEESTGLLPLKKKIEDARLCEKCLARELEEKEVLYVGIICGLVIYQSMVMMPFFFKIEVWRKTGVILDLLFGAIIALFLITNYVMVFCWIVDIRRKLKMKLRPLQNPLPCEFSPMIKIEDSCHGFKVNGM